MEDKVGVYICTGWGISEALDLDALSKTAGEFNVAVCKTIGDCSEDDFNTIKNDVQSEA